MGTRNLTCAVIGGDYAIAQYGQFDGYPSGQGITVLKFLRDDLDEELLKSRLKDRKLVTTDEQWAAMWAEVGVDVDTTPYVNDMQSAAFKQRYPFMDRCIAGEIFERVQNSTADVVLKNNLNFAADSLMCEWVYVVDFDKRTFEVYSGFNKHPVDSAQRFADLQPERSEYHQVAFRCQFDLDDLPSDKEFLAQAQDPTEDYE